MLIMSGRDSSSPSVFTGKFLKKRIENRMMVIGNMLLECWCINFAISNSYVQLMNFEDT